MMPVNSCFDSEPHLTCVSLQPLLPTPQLDAARKDAEAQRKRAAAIGATAATAMATPFAAESAAHHDEDDAEVDDLLHQLQVGGGAEGAHAEHKLMCTHAVGAQSC